MAYLSNRDFYNEFDNDNLLIYPFKGENIQGASINLTASEFAWDVNTKKRLSLKKYNNFIVPPLATIAIETEEVVYVGLNICGTFHSKVGMAARGFSNISTTLDPGHIGTSLVYLQNNTSTEQEIVIGETFVTLMLSYVSQSAHDKIYKANSPGQRELVSGFVDGKLFLDKQSEDGYHDNPYRLKVAMKETSKKWEEWKKDFKENDPLLIAETLLETNRRNRIFAFAKVCIYFFSFGLLISVVFFAIKCIEKNPSLNNLEIYVELIGIVLVFAIIPGLKRLEKFIEKRVKKKVYKNGN